MQPVARSTDAIPTPSSSDPRISAQTAFNRFDAELYRFVVVRLSGDRSAADEIMQQLWIKSRANSELMEPDHAERWLRRVAANLINEAWRRSKRDPSKQPDHQPTLAKWIAERIDHELLPPEQIERNEVKEQLLLALTELAANDQRLLLERYVDETSLAELSERHRVSVRAIEGRLYRARQKLKATLLSPDQENRSETDAQSTCQAGSIRPKHAAHRGCN